MKMTIDADVIPAENVSLLEKRLTEPFEQVMFWPELSSNDSYVWNKKKNGKFSVIRWIEESDDVLETDLDIPLSTVQTQLLASYQGSFEWIEKLEWNHEYSWFDKKEVRIAFIVIAIVAFSAGILVSIFN